MEDTQNKLITKKNIISLLLIGIILLIIPVGVKMIKEQQIFRSKAAADTIVFSGPSVSQDKTTTTSPSLIVELKSPLGPPVPVK